uniref:Glucagon like peptide 2 receptor n=1 Tax=Seriola lalandi dorsalis TaxID=1841481 RepID=A0A3B4WEF1_SERLL
MRNLCGTGGPNSPLFLKVSCSVLESLIAKRTEYWETCNRTLAAAGLSKTGNYCRGTFDTFVCWPHSSPGNVSVPCPSYLPWINGSRRAHRECLENGRWRQRGNSSELWRDDSECQEDQFFKDEVRRTQGHTQNIDAFLQPIRCLFTRKLHCTRNYIHMNLFVSFILRAVAVISKEIILYVMYSNLPKDDPGWNSYSSSAFSKVCMEYFVACNYFWLLVEAIFLHTLLFTAVLTKRRLLKKYMLLGWGKLCVIFCIFIKILMLLLSKLKADLVKFTDYRYSLARATLVLIPLLGIHEVVFTVLIDECVEGNSRYARNFINLTLSSFQGFLVAVLYCFANGEVQAELKKRWQLFLFTNHFQIRGCFRGRRPRCSRGVIGLGGVKGQGLKGYDAAGLDFLTRKSLSSSDGEMTLGETMEEILEESEF